MSQATSKPAVSTRDRDAVLQALRAGVVPRRGLQHIQVGREAEITAIVADIDRILEGGAGIRFVVGDYGAGKTYLLSLIRAIALEKGLLHVSADLNPDRRLYGAGGQGRSLYNELTRNLATRTKPEGGGMTSVVERFVSSAIQEAKQQGKSEREIIDARLQGLSELVGGYDFATVVERYWTGFDTANDALKTDAVRWLRGEFSTITDARKALGVRTIIDDDNVYDGLKLFARFAKLSGYGGLLVGLDELVNLHKLQNSQARNGNYEQILRILNDAIAGSAEHIGFIFGATPETISDTRRGLFSYAALQSRLAENRFAAQHGVQDFGGPIIRLANLTPEDLFVLLTKLRDVHGGRSAQVLDHAAIASFLAFCLQRIGAAYFQTPRTTIRAFLDLMAVIELKPEASIADLLEGVAVEPDHDPAAEDLPEAAPTDAAAAPAGPEDDLTSFKL